MRMWKRLAAAGAAALPAMPAFARSLGDMAKEAEADLRTMSGFLEIAFYLVGVLIVVFGFFRIKKHMDQPQQVSLASAIVAILIGAAIILTPIVIEGIADTFGATGGGGRPSLRL